MEILKTIGIIIACIIGAIIGIWLKSDNTFNPYKQDYHNKKKYNKRGQS